MVLGTCLMAFFAAPGLAHVTNSSTSRVRVEGKAVSYRLEMAPVDLAVAAGLIPAAGAPLEAALFSANRAKALAYLSQRLIVYGNNVPCTLEPPLLDTGRFPKIVAATFRFNCPRAPDTLLIQYLVFAELDAHHASLGTLTAGGGRLEFVLDADHPELETRLADLQADLWGQAWRFGLLGARHILTGTDHLLFLLALIVANLAWRHLLTVVTMFTLAHTLTLLLAAFGWVTLPGAWVEAVIALTIAYVALENLLGWSLRYRWALTFVFGLAHGLGFASALSELTAREAPGLTALFAFNLGVEAGQLAAVSLVYPVLMLVARLRVEVVAMRAVSLAVLAAAIYWLVVRTVLA